MVISNSAISPLRICSRPPENLILSSFLGSEQEIIKIMERKINNHFDTFSIITLLFQDYCYKYLQNQLLEN